MVATDMPRVIAGAAAEKLALSELTAVGPMDGRYGAKVAGLRASASEFGLIKARATVEIRWLQMLSELSEVEEVPPFSAATNAFLDEMTVNWCGPPAFFCWTISGPS